MHSKIWSLPMAGGFLLMLMTGCQTKEHVTLSGDYLGVTSEVIELHAMDDEGSVSAVFKLFNQGEEDTIQVQDVSTSCSCAAAKLQSNEIPPGSEISLNITVNLKQDEGVQQSTVLVRYSVDGNSYEKQLRVAVKISRAADLVLNPSQWYFDELSAGEDFEKHFKITQRPGASTPASPVEICTPEWMSYRLQGEDGHKYIWNLILTGKVPDQTGMLRSEMVIKTERRCIVIPIVGRLKGNLEIEPRSLIWVVGENRSESRSVKIRHANGLNIQHIICPPDTKSNFLGVEANIKADTAELAFSVPPDAPNGAMAKGNAEFRVVFEDQSEETVRVPYLVVCKSTHSQSTETSEPR